MNQKEQIKRLLFFALPMTALLVMLALGMTLSGREAEESSKDMIISLDSGFYTEDQKIEVSVPNGVTVFYTDNCEEPGRENGTEYTAPILVAASDEERVHVYRFKAYGEDGGEWEQAARTYFMGTGVDSRYTTNVLHITGDPEELFGYEEGIFVAGKTFDEFIQANPNAHFGGELQANFMLRGREYEREVFIEYFSDDGKLLLAQNGGIRIHGQATRMKNQKSFRLYARKEYDECNEFKYPFLSQMLSFADGTVAREHKRLVVRNAGTDNGFAFIRNELIGALAGDAGYPDVMYAVPVCVYINGQYNGVYWIENNFDEQYFANRYGEYTGSFVVLEGGDNQKLDDEEDEQVQKYVEEYNRLYQEFAKKDLTVWENYEQLNAFLDVENYLKYCAIENYIGNSDWPHNNVKVYRYVSEDGKYQEDGVFDGRYRHILYDTDCSLGLFVQNGTIGIGPLEHNLETLLSDQSPLFAALMKREDCRNYFVNYSCDLMNGAMSYDHISETLAQMHDSRDEELHYMLEETELLKEEMFWTWEDSSGITYENVENSCQTILEFAGLRPQAVLSDLIGSFGFDASKAYTLNLRKSGMSWVRVNSLSVEEEEFSGVYLGCVPLLLEPETAKNEVFDCWIVNGEIRKEEQLYLTDEDIVDYQIAVEMVTYIKDEPVLLINALKAKGNSDYVELINLSDKVLSTKGYYLSDSDDPYKYALPVMALQPGETQRFYGRNCGDVEGLGQPGMNFNLKWGETLTMTCRQETLESILIPDLSENGRYQRRGVGEEFAEVLYDE